MTSIREILKYIGGAALEEEAEILVALGRIEALLQQIVNLMQAPVRIRLDTANAEETPQPIPAQKGP